MSHPLVEAERLLAEGDPAGALLRAEAALRRRPGHLAAQILRARCLLESGRLGEADEQLSRTLAADPLHRVAARLRVEVGLREGLAGLARARLEDYRRLGAGAEEIDPLERRLEGLAEDGSPAGAVGGGAPQALVTVTLGNLYLSQGHRTEAAAIFRALLAANPDDEDARRGLARAVAGR